MSQILIMWNKLIDISIQLQDFLFLVMASGPNCKKGVRCPYPLVVPE